MKTCYWCNLKYESHCWCTGAVFVYFSPFSFWVQILTGLFTNVILIMCLSVSSNVGPSAVGRAPGMLGDAHVAQCMQHPGGTRRWRRLEAGGGRLPARVALAHAKELRGLSGIAFEEGKSTNNACGSGWSGSLLLTKNPVCSRSCSGCRSARCLVWTYLATAADR